MVDVGKQPAKAVFITYHVLSSLLVRFPLWTAIGLVPALRPRRSWTLGRVFRTRLIEYLIYVSGRLGPSGRRVPNHFAIAPGSHMKGIWIEPVPHLVLGQIKEWADNAKVSPVRIPGYLLDKPGSDIAPNAPASRGEQIILTCHGGAYIFGSANPDDPTANIGKGILEHVQSIRRILSVEYRLSAGPPFTPANPFPAALLDALAAYNHLVNVLGFEPQNIILEGDSAGANLVLTLTKYLVEYRDELTKTTLPGSIPLDIPGGLICCSPWADLGKSHHREPAPYLARSDYIGNSRGPRANYGASAFVGPLGLTIADTNEYISPASKFINKVSFAGWPRSLIIASDAEYLAPAIRTLKERMAEDMGEGASAGQVSYIEVPDGIHDFICFPWHEPERSQVLQGIADWVDQ